MKKATPTFTETHTMYNLFPLMARTAVLAAIPKTIDVIHASLFKKETPYVEPKQVRRRRLKPVDTTKLTQGHYHVVMIRHKRMLDYNEGRPMATRITTQELTDGLNLEFGLNKSITAYSNFWRGAVSKESLPVADGFIKMNPVPAGSKYSHLLG